MTFVPRMTAETRALRTLRPLDWRRWSGVVADVWHVRGENGAGGFYVSPDPRLVVFLDPGGESVRLATSPDGHWMTGIAAFYIPPGVPLWSRVGDEREFAHLDLHLERGPLLQRLAALRAGDCLDAPLFLPPSERVAGLARLIAAEIVTPARPDLAVDGLLTALLAEIFELGRGGEAEMQGGGLPPQVVRRLKRHVSASLDRRVSVAEMAEVAGLSESWFTRALKRSEGVTPQRWVMRLRLDAATELMADPGRRLAEIAAATGFADQAHLTRAFRAACGQTPGAWRRGRFEADGSSGAGPVQAGR